MTTTRSTSLIAAGWRGWLLMLTVAGATGVAGFELGETLQTRTALEAQQAQSAIALAGVAKSKAHLTALRDSISLTRATATPSDSTQVIVVSLAENRLWVRERGEEVFTTRVASGSGRTLVGSGRGQQYKFDTPRGRLRVLSKETAPAWVPPDWHFVEKAGKKGMGLVRMKRGQIIPVSDGVITTRGSDVVKRHRDGSVSALTATDGRELVASGRIIIPPFGTNARRYKEILGTHRLNLGDGYALHGTNNPNSIGSSVSHGCVRLRNEDIETLYRMIPVGTTVYIY